MKKFNDSLGNISFSPFQPEKIEEPKSDLPSQNILK